MGTINFDWKYLQHVASTMEIDGEHVNEVVIKVVLGNQQIYLPVSLEDMLYKLNKDVKFLAVFHSGTLFIG